MTQPIYALPDIHGQRAMLEHALSLIDADGGGDARVVFLGDLVDRGPDSRGVIQTLIDGIASGRDWIVLKGNHDDYVPRFLDHGDAHASLNHPELSWFSPRLGGQATMTSYGVDIDGRDMVDILRDARAAIPQAHRDFLAGLKLWHQEDGLLFVHAGIRPGVPLADQTAKDMMWIREPFLSHPDPFPWLVVHGHTAIDAPRHCGNRVNLDGGAGWGRPLRPAVFEDGKSWLLSDAGRAVLEP
ncbi:metallophosphoesterase [Roseovarius sp. PS-C2]|uniref:metallophosphoesterase n=1 Tax=Roseovarius sp. PS-C2 TaxID=2820814 RepID=UPI001C0B37CC|nr:metallophosphoesterase [Roseovarius sp. PS-C2]MBU3260685.1 metallophosphoesterase [Roseovarius sp. PS-C2]